jgi:hypothetical protein
MQANAGNAAAPNPFIDKGEFHSFMAQQEKQFDAELAKQTAAAP